VHLRFCLICEERINDGALRLKRSNQCLSFAGDLLAEFWLLDRRAFLGEELARDLLGLLSSATSALGLVGVVRFDL
jgi:hypothetical protein